jgi:hypothetical protein
MTVELPMGNLCFMNCSKKQKKGRKALLKFITSKQINRVGDIAGTSNWKICIQNNLYHI